ncbi:sigma-70 family RNA polymerase sigma factor [Halalkalibacterium ligniniphilum]|uniref:sigma-70 family RNA polymerase sigma factor n=1 Tax=Halalkalibacterium ligniniphilum TaxID=1134413 RepID=UPI000344F065|nr:sigma-70 family RNA polymerase sigma factor [Halalkalibacterium ligniniphilum]
MNGSSFEDVLKAFEPLIKSQIRKLNLFTNHEEFYHVAVIALWEAYRKFDDKKGSFEAYAKQTVRGYLLMQLQSEQKFTKMHKIHHDPYVDENRKDPCVHYDTYDMDSITPYVHSLSPRERLWVYEAIIVGKKTGEIAAEQNVSTNTVGTWRKQALKKMRNSLKDRSFNV